MLESLALPENYNPETFLLANTTENGVFHESRAGAELARNLVANGTPQDIELAHQVLNATLKCQERREDDPHFGNFMWMAEDNVVDDLNAVQFNLEHLIPMMIRHGDRLSSTMQKRVLDSIRLGLEEIRRIDVSVAYSNIVVLDIVNSCLGGELLNDTKIAQRGYKRLIDWIAYTDQHGTPREANSPTYTRVIIHALKYLTDLVQDEATRIRSRTIVARLGISVALHIHRSTGRWSGPHSRAYHPSVIGETPPEIETLQSWLSDGHLPAWISDLLDYPINSFEITETADTSLQAAITTYQSEAFSLGVLSREYGGQSNVLLAHYVQEGAERPGVMYTRYLMDDKWLGDFYHATDRTKSRNLIEEGRFLGVQQCQRAIGLYIPQDMTLCSSAKANVIFTQYQFIEEVWVGDKKIETLPANVSEGQTVVIGSGSAYIAIRPLTRTDKGRNSPLRLVEKAGDLVLEIYNYKGSEKRFWELDTAWGPFFQGYPQCGIYIELADRKDYPDGRAFGHVVNQGNLIDKADEPFTYDGQSERLWTVEYERDDQLVGIEVDLMTWHMKRRWTQTGDPGWPMLESPMVKQNRSGKVRVGEATLICGEASAWLYANPKAKRWVAGYHGQSVEPLTLTLPTGQVKIAGMGTGTVIWDNGNVTIDAIDLQGEPALNNNSA